MAKPKTKIQDLDPCLPRPQDVMTPAELVAWERRVRGEKRKGAEGSKDSDNGEKD
jgi:hypothetical protein